MKPVRKSRVKLIYSSRDGVFRLLDTQNIEIDTFHPSEFREAMAALETETICHEGAEL